MWNLVSGNKEMNNTQYEEGVWQLNAKENIWLCVVGGVTEE